jgi:sortase B
MKKIINLVLIGSLSFSIFSIGKKMYTNHLNKVTYEKAREEKVEMLREYDWITIPNTYIDYPIAYGEGNDYYLNHDINGKENSAGSIFYSEEDEPFNKLNTIIYGHCLRNGKMFNNLHTFKDKDVFEKSKVILETKNGEVKEYLPLGIYLTNEDFFYFDLDNMEINEAVELIQEKSIHKLDVDYNENSTLLTLLTCDYTEEGNRLIVFYINNN